MKYDNVKIPNGYYRIIGNTKLQVGDLYLNPINFPAWVKEWCFVDENSIYLNNEANKFDFVVRKKRGIAKMLFDVFHY